MRLRLLGLRSRRLPPLRLREPRLRALLDKQLENLAGAVARLCGAAPHACPVAIELRPNAESLVDFIHPDADGGPTPPVYVFGPEDGSLPGPLLKRCHRFVVIPSFECLNLATSVATVLYDRMSKMPPEARPAVRGRRSRVRS